MNERHVAETEGIYFLVKELLYECIFLIRSAVGFGGIQISGCSISKTLPGTHQVMLLY